jgi:glutathione S-transferase
VNLARFEHLEPWYLRINPNGLVPALVHDGEPVVESRVIAEYLDEVFPDPPLAPPGPLGRARMRAWLHYIDEVPTAAVRVPSFNDALLPGYAALPAGHLEELAERMPVRAEFFRRLGRSGFPPAEREAALRQLSRAVERVAGSAAPWLCGDRFTAADACMAPLFQRMEDLGLERIWADLPRAGAWFGAVRARTSWPAAFPPGSRLGDALGEAGAARFLP